MHMLGISAQCESITFASSARNSCLASTSSTADNQLLHSNQLCDLASMSSTTDKQLLQSNQLRVSLLASTCSTRDKQLLDNYNCTAAVTTYSESHVGRDSQIINYGDPTKATTAKEECTDIPIIMYRFGLCVACA